MFPHRGMGTNPFVGVIFDLPTEVTVRRGDWVSNVLVGVSWLPSMLEFGYGQLCLVCIFGGGVIQCIPVNLVDFGGEPIVFVLDVVRGRRVL